MDSLNGSNLGLNGTTNGIYDDLRNLQRSLQARVKKVRGWYDELSMKEGDKEDFDLQMEYIEFDDSRMETIIDLWTWHRNCGLTMAANIDEKTLMKVRMVGKTLRLMKLALRGTKPLGEEEEEQEELQKKEEEWLKKEGDDGWEEQIKKRISEVEKKDGSIRRLMSAKTALLEV